MRNFIANGRLGTESVTIHENVLGLGAIVPWHMHATEEIIVVLSGTGECQSEDSTATYSTGDVLIVPAGLKHSVSNTGDQLLRQLCIFPSDPVTKQLESDGPGQTVETVNA